MTVRCMAERIRSHSISAWLSDGKFYLKSPLYMACEDHVWEHFWVSFDDTAELHEASDFPLIPFDAARTACFSYLSEACKLLDRSNPQWTPDDRERRKIVETLGPPPLNSYTIYMMTVSNADGSEERVVYIGKTNSESHRFRGGHAAISKLHAPNYQGLRKKIYFGCIVGFDDDCNYIPIDWIQPEMGRDGILSDIEYQLIYCTQPELNDTGKETCRAKNRVSLYVQNFCSRVLDGASID